VANSEVITYKGIRFRRYPDSPNWAEKSYYTPGIADKQRGVRRLHEEIWIDAHGPIPDGCHIHHDDHDPLNNDLGNLVCLTSEEHAAEHEESWSERSSQPAQLAHLEAIRSLAVAWHRSPEGHDWHVEHGKRTWEGRESTPRTCEQCSTPFESVTLRADDRFCSNACKSAWRRDAGLDDVDRTCHQCGDVFRVNKYSGKRHCSRACGARCRWASEHPCLQSDGG
jgi:hypothetical protein